MELVWVALGVLVATPLRFLGSWACPAHRGTSLPTWDLLVGTLMIATAAVTFLYGRGVLPRKPEDPAALEQWRSQWATPLKWVPPLLLVVGLFRIGAALL